MLYRLIAIYWFVGFCLVGCGKQDQLGVTPDATDPAAKETRLIILSPEYQCRRAEEFAGKEYDIVLCSMGEIFIKKSTTSYEGDGIKILKRSAGKITALRKLDELGVSQMPSLVEILSGQQDNTTKVRITAFAESYPGWQPEPLFAEEVDPADGIASVRILKSIPRFNRIHIEKIFGEINGSLEEIDRRAERIGVSRIDLIYGHLFALRDYGFREPALIESLFKSLESKDWNDGEVAGVTAMLKAQVAYMTGKKVEGIN